MTIEYSQKELFHLALHASKNQRTDESLRYLKQLLKQEPEHPEALFLIGSEYAEISMFDEAIECMSKALVLLPEADVVRFQLAMLHFAMNNYHESKELLSTLLEATADNPYHFLAKGITLLANDSKEEALTELKQALTMPLNNPALVANMEQFIGHIEKNIDNPELIDLPNENSREMFLSAYKNKSH